MIYRASIYKNVEYSRLSPPRAGDRGRRRFSFFGALSLHVPKHPGGNMCGSGLVAGDKTEELVHRPSRVKSPSLPFSPLPRPPYISRSPFTEICDFFRCMIIRSLAGRVLRKFQSVYVCISENLECKPQAVLCSNVEYNSGLSQYRTRNLVLYLVCFSSINIVSTRISFVGV